MSERGSILPLIGGAVALALVMVFGVTSATSLLLERHRLYALADSVAVVAAESFSLQTVRLTGVGVEAPLTSGGVLDSVENYLSRAGVGSLRDVKIERAHTPNGQVAEVTLSSRWSPPVISDFFPQQLQVSATARAHVIIR
ncbi:MAG: hypothetical protein K9G09_01790 [Pontimonas sp.]|nr:hypothetical protein [Pontimonas sp.]